MKKSGLKQLLMSGLLSMAIPALTAQENCKMTVEPYQWKNVQIAGGGFVDGIVFHPAVKNLRYCRTDMGGAYRWDEKLQRWLPLLDWLPYKDLNLMGVESIALDPADPKRLYLACGTYTNPSTPDGAILYSEDQGKTFGRTNVPIKFGGNENGRGNGERMAVDPENGKILYLGTRHNGLWKSTDRALSWSRVDNFPSVTEKAPVPPTGEAGGGFRRFRPSMGSGVVFVVFDPASGTAGKACNTIYVGVSLMGRDNFYRTNNAGQSWEPVPGQPTLYRPSHCVRASDGTLYLSYGTDPGPSRMINGAIWKYEPSSEKWTDITPDKPDSATRKLFGYGAVSVDARNPLALIATSFGRPGEAGGEEIFRSIDGGKSWKPILKNKAVFDYTKAPYVSHTGIHWMLDAEIDPFNSNHALVTTGYGGHETFDLTDADKDKPVTWSIMSTGIEETVALDLLSPSAGPWLISAIGDYCGFAHTDLDRPEPSGCFDYPHFGNTNSLACAELKPEIIVRAGILAGGRKGSNMGYSVDGGKSWKPTENMPKPDSRLGIVAVSADGSSWVWTPERSAVYFTKDQGKSWSPVSGLPENTRVIADRENPEVFYAMQLFDGHFYFSTDGGQSFSEQPLIIGDSLPHRGWRGDNRGGQDRLYATPGHSGDLWLAAFDGLYHSTNAGKSFTRLPLVQEIHAFGFGMHAPGMNDPALYLVGTIQGCRGIFRSDDMAKNWIKINDEAHQWGLVLHITGDPKKYGRVYVGTHGRGIQYGDPVGIK